MKKPPILLFLFAILVAGGAITVYRWQLPGSMVAQEAGYLKMAWTRISEIGEATGQFPSSVLELAVDAPDPGFKNWLTENADRVHMPLMGQSYHGTDPKLVAFELEPRSGRSREKRLFISVGGAAKIRD